METEGLSMEEKEGALQIWQELWSQIGTAVLLLSILLEPSCFTWTQPPVLLTTQGCDGGLRCCLRWWLVVSSSLEETLFPASSF